MAFKFSLLFTTGERRVPQKGILGRLIFIACISLTLFEIWLGAFGTIHPYFFSAIFLLLVMAINFIVSAPFAGDRYKKISWIDIILSLMTIFFLIYLIVNMKRFTTRIVFLDKLSAVDLLSRQYGMLGMNGIRRYEEKTFYVIPLQNIFKALLMIASIFLAEGLPFLGRSRVASDQSRLFASLDGAADDTSPTSNTDQSHPSLILFRHEHFLLFDIDFSRSWKILTI